MTKYAIVPVDYDGLIACKPPLDAEMLEALALAKLVGPYAMCECEEYSCTRREIKLARALLRANGEDV